MSNRITRRQFVKKAGQVGGSIAFTSTFLNTGAVAYGQGASDTLTFATTALPAGIDPHIDSADIWQRRKPLFYETLVWVDYDLRPQPMLAEDWEQRSETEWVFKIREDVKFHNGQKMDAEDVKFSYDRILDPSIGSGGTANLSVVDSIEVLDKYRVKISTAAPSGSLLVNLGDKFAGVIPKDTFNGKMTGPQLHSKVMGTGPFKLDQFQPNTKMVLKRNEDYWQEGMPKVDQITFTAVPDESTILANLRSGRVDMAQFADTTNYFLLQGEKNLDIHSDDAIFWNTLDLVGDMPPTDEVEIRQAIQLSLDREAIFQTAGNGLGSRLGFLPPAMEDWALPIDELNNQHRDIAKARDLIQQSSYSRPVPLKLRTISGFEALRNAIQVVVSNLTEVGFKVNVETVDIGVWISDWRQGNIPCTMNAWGGFTDPDAPLFSHFHSKPEAADFRRWNNEEADKLLEKGRYTIGREERIDIYNDFQKLITGDGISIPLWSPILLFSSQPYVKGFEVYPTGFYWGLRKTSLEK